MRIDSDTPIHKLLGHAPNIITSQVSDRISSQHLVGVEVELEKFSHGLHDELKYWRLEGDGSLREGGVEFVLRVPLTGIDLDNAAHELQDEVQKSGAEANQRCSTHIHLDVRNFTMRQVRLLVMAYAMYEKFIFKYVGGDRDRNFYCVPMHKSLDNRRMIVKALRSGDFRHSPKYSAINIKPIQRFGSVEFRMQQGIMSADSLLQWARIIQCFAEFAEANPETELEAVLGRYSQGGPMDLFHDIFGPEANALLAESGGLTDQDLRECLISAQDMIVMARDDSALHYLMGQVIASKDRDVLDKIKTMQFLDTDYLKSVVKVKPAAAPCGSLFEEFINYIEQ